VTTAGLLPGAGIRAALRDRGDLDLALLPAEAVNDDMQFIDDVTASDLANGLPMEVRLSYDFVDALSECGIRNAECGIEGPRRSQYEARPDIPHSALPIPHFGVGEGRG